MAGFNLPLELQTYFEQSLPNILKEHQIPGASLAIVKDGKIVYQNGFGYKDFEEKSLVDTQTLFAVGVHQQGFYSRCTGRSG